VEAAAEIPEGNEGRRQNEGRKRAHKPVTSQAGQSNASSNTTASSSTSRGVCSVQKWREAARGTAADRPTRQCQLLVTEVADDPG
jgi:hypothetical protein